MKTRIIALLLTAILVGPVVADEKEGVALTVYNGGYGVVRETRQMEIGKDGDVRFTDVAQRIDATTVHFKSLTDPSAKLLEQNYQYDLVSADKLLRKYIDREIDVVTEALTYGGKLLSFDGGQIVLMDKDKGGITMIQRPDNVRDIRFKELPEGLLTRPTLVWLVDTQKPGEQMLEVSYQTGGVGWHAEYVMVLADSDKAADLSGWVSVQNNSGKTYRDAKLKFIAGDVHRVTPPRLHMPNRRLREKATGDSHGMEEKAFFEYHMYTLGRPSTVADNEVKQLEMFPPAREIQVDKKYLYNPLGNFRWSGGGRYTDPRYGVDTGSKKVQVYVEFRNEAKNKLGIPLPAGKIRVYKRDADEAMEFIGEERIDHTPKDEDLSLLIGNAFDVVGERVQKGFRVESGRNWMQEKIEIKVRNHKEEDIVVRVKEPMYRYRNWKVTEKSHEFEKLDSRTIAFDVPVKKDGETVVTYTVDYTW